MPHPGSELAPYREGEETPLEALVRRGPASLERSSPWLGSLVRVTFTYFALCTALIVGLVVWPLMPVIVVLLIWRYNRGVRRRHAQAAGRMHAYARGAAIPIAGVERWCATGGGLAGVELVFAPLSALAERAVQITVPEARISREGERVVVRWTMDLPQRTARLIRLLDTLGPHRDELDLVRVVCR